MSSFEEDFEKIQRRQGEREVFLEGLKKIIFDLEEECISDSPEYSREEAIMAFHSVLSTRIVDRFLHGEENEHHFCHMPPVFNLLSEEILPRIEEFTPVEEEQLYILACILEYSIGEIKLPFEQRMLHLSVPLGRDRFLKEIGYA